MPLDSSGRDSLVREIELAFRGVSLKDGIGVFEARAIDSCVSDKLRARARSQDQRDDWMAIPDPDLEEHYSALSFMDADGIRFALPAYMRFAVRNFDKSQSLSVDAPIYCLESGWAAAPNAPELFTQKQLATIAKFLRVMSLDVGDDWVDAASASRAYELFWNQYDKAA